MSTILAVETSTLTASVALVRDGSIVLAKEGGVNDHSESLLTLVDECLAAGNVSLRELDTIAVGAGPGSFTGLRIGMATVKGLCFAADVSLTPVSSLAALSWDARPLCDEGRVIAAVLDARRKEIFTGLFVKTTTGLEAIGAEQVMAPSALGDFLDAELDEEQRAHLALYGDGAAKYSNIVSTFGPIRDDGPQTPSASAVAFLAAGKAPVDVLASAKPTYVRLPEAEIKFPDGNTGGTFAAQRAGTHSSHLPNK